MGIDITEAIILGIMVASALSLGSIIGKARLRRKMRRREEEEKLADYLPGEERFPNLRKDLEDAIEKQKPILARYVGGEPKMEVCEIEEVKEDDETRDGKDGFGVGEGHDGPIE